MGRSDSRPVHELTEADLQRHHVWQFMLDADGTGDVDESHASPTTTGLRLGEYGSFIVAATSLLRNGQELPGAVQVDLLGSKVLVTPTHLFVQGKTLDPLASDAEARVARVTKSSNADPSRWRLDELFIGESEFRSGRIAKAGIGQAVGLLARLLSLRFARRHR